MTDSLNGEIIAGIEKVARGRGYSVLLGNTRGSERREREFANLAFSRQADGMCDISYSGA